MANTMRPPKRVRQARSSASRAAPAVSGAAPRLYARAFEILAARIGDGSLAPGTRLLESHVADDFGISRAPARQALQRLAAEGLVARAERHGYVVSGSAMAAKEERPAEPFGPIRLTSAPSWERIYNEVESAIVARTAIASWRVIESELAKYHDVSRTVARDVVARLHHRGVIRRDEKARWFAPALTRGHVAELYQMRWLLEPVALLDALGSAPPGLVTDIREHLEAALGRAETLDGAALDALEDDLHVRLLGHCRNRTLMDALRFYQSLLIAHSFLYGRAPHLYPVEPFLPEHLRIVERAEKGHADEAAKALEDHLRVSLDRAVSRIEVVVREFRPEGLPYLEPLKAAAV